MSRHTPTVSVYNQTRDTLVASRVQVADSSWARLVGLLGKRSLDPDSGLWIIPSNSVHTLGMQFPIDVIFLDRDRRICHLFESLRPFRITRPRWRARTVLELAPQTIGRTRTQPGDQLVIT